MQKVIIALILVIIVVVAAFNIVASLTMIVLSKVREVAILKSMGASSTMVARIFLIGGTTVGPDRHRPRASATACSSACWRASTATRWIRRCI